MEAKLVGISSSVMNTENMDFKEALHMLLHREKVTRNENDIDANARILSDILDLCVQQKEWKSLSECVGILVGKHSCVQESAQTFIQGVVKALGEIQEKQVRLQLIGSLQSACNGRLCLEREHVEVTKMLARMHADDGQISKAADALAEVKVDSYGLLTQREKVEFILLQMRYLITSGQGEKADILSKKLQLKFFNDPKHEDLKIEFHDMKVELERWKSYLETSRHFWAMSSCESLPQQLRTNMIINSAAFCALAPKCHAQVAFTQVLLKDPLLVDMPIVCRMLDLLSSKELISATDVRGCFKTAMERTRLMPERTKFREKCLSDLGQRIIEHNILTIASYYSRINLSRMAELLQTSVQSSEENVTQLVNDGLMTARIDRFTGVVDFSVSCVRECVLNEWAETIRRAMEGMNLVAYHVQKEVGLKDDVQPIDVE